MGTFRSEYKIKYLQEQEILGCRLRIIMLQTHLIVWATLLFLQPT